MAVTLALFNDFYGFTLPAPFCQLARFFISDPRGAICACTTRD